jgi:hypothetical protein
VRERRAAGIVAIAALVLLPLDMAGAQDSQGTFHAGVDVVEVPVAVRDGGGPLTGLDTAGFVLTDNGVRQQIDAVSMAVRPLDVSLVVDMSLGSLSRPSYFHAFESFRSDARVITGLLSEEDRLQVTTFAAVVADVRPMTRVSHSDGPLPLQNPTAGVARQDLTGALLYAFAWPTQAGRSRVILLLWNPAGPKGDFVGGTLPLDALGEVAEHSDAVLYAVMAPPLEQARDPTSLPEPSIMKLARKTVAATAALTGGRALTAGNATGALRDIVKEFRSGYLLRYTVHGVPKSGWHELSVTVPSCPKCIIQARNGYFGE